MLSKKVKANLESVGMQQEFAVSVGYRHFREGFANPRAVIY
jgi:hypothetical protein